MLTIERFAYMPFGTYGRVAVGDDIFYTVEKPWQNNLPFKSCIPEGVYELKEHKSSKYGLTYALTNDYAGVTHYKEPHSKRFACLFHTANYPKDVQGCIGLGDRVRPITGDVMVTNSKVTTTRFLQFIRDSKETHITISQYTPSYA